MKHSFILSVIMALGIVFSAPKAEAANWPKIAESSLYGTLALGGVVKTVWAISLFKDKPAGIADTMAGVFGMVIPYSILTLIFAKGLYNSITKDSAKQD